MNKTFVIQCVRTKEYYTYYGAYNGFDANLNEATKFKSEEVALKEMENEDLEDIFFDKYIEIKRYFIQKEK